MPDLEISKLPPLGGAVLQGLDLLAVADLSASETKKVTAKDLVQFGVALIDPGSIPPDKLNYTLQPNSVASVNLQNHAVTGLKLADNSTGVVGAGLPAAGDYIGQLALDQGGNKASIWNGSAWVSFKAAGSINTVQPDSTGNVLVTVAQTGDTVQLGGRLSDTTAARQFLAGPTAAAGAISHRQILGTDLPAATGISLGGVVVNGDGLRVTPGGTIQIDNDLAAGTTYGVVTYNAKGLVTGGRALTSGDLPLATSSAPGAAYPGPGLTVTATGQLNHTNSVPAGQAAKVAFDSEGHITAALGLSAADIPDIPATKLTSGLLPAACIGDRSITQRMMGDYSFAYIQESVPPAGVGAHPIGMIWLQESTGQVSVWNGNSWMKTGASTLFNRNLRYGGTYNGATAVVTGVTQFGTAEGFKVGDTIPAADDKIAGLYFVASAGGASSSLASGAVMDAGDWLLCQGTSGGWVRIDTLSGGGGGGGSTVSNLDDLLDVTLTSPTSGDFLQLNAGGQWVNVSVLDEGTWT